MTSGEKIDFQEGVVFATDEGSIGEDGQFGVFGAGFGDEGLVKFLVACEIVLEARFGLFRTALNNGPIGLGD